jgi:hypothetical protein
MIQEKLSILNNNSSIPWQTLLANVITDPLTLLKMLELEDHFSEKMRKVIQTFPLRGSCGLC